MKTLLVVYDISEPRRLQRIAKLMMRYGVRAQKSVFECELGEARCREMAQKLADLIDEEADQVRIYAVPSAVLEEQWVIGREAAPLPDETVVV